ncbi:DUF3592 domain-containing protein [Labedaea rhizosphaerae]|nr:DUF3592 domain-containing protein [Labedaea rhizosphaerae]
MAVGVMRAMSGKGRRIATWVLLAVASVLTLLCLLLFIGGMRNDIAIGSHIGYANAEVVSTSFGRTVVRFNTPDGAVHSPPDGILYPKGLVPGQIVRVEYDQRNPELARVAGRSITSAWFPLTLIIVVAWGVVIGVLHWLRTRS